MHLVGAVGALVEPVDVPGHPVAAIPIQGETDLELRGQGHGLIERLVAVEVVGDAAAAQVVVVPGRVAAARYRYLVAEVPLPYLPEEIQEAGQRVGLAEALTIRSMLFLPDSLTSSTSPIAISRSASPIGSISWPSTRVMPIYRSERTESWPTPWMSVMTTAGASRPLRRINGITAEGENKWFEHQNRLCDAPLFFFRRLW